MDEDHKSQPDVAALANPRLVGELVQTGEFAALTVDTQSIPFLRRPLVG